jgi:hypothetical protein
MTHGNLSTSRFLRFAILSTALLLTLVPGFSPLVEAQSTGTTTVTARVTGTRNTNSSIATLTAAGRPYPRAMNQVRLRCRG